MNAPRLDDQDPEILRLDLGIEDITLGHLIEAQERFLSLIREVAGGVVGNKEDVRWIVEDVEANSLDLALRASPARDSVPKALMADVVSAVARGLERIEREAYRPPYFSDAALQQAHELAKLRGRGVTRIQVKAAVAEATVTTRTVANVEEVVGQTITAIGTIEGTLEAVTVHGDRVFNASCAGIDIGKRSLTVCVIRSDPSGEPVKETRTFRTLTRDLLALADWLDERGVTAVAMEATGSYWKPIWNLLEERFELLLANAAHLKAVPGRKTDVRDAEWIAELFRHGLLRASFIPPRPERELRELVRYRTGLIRERASEINRLAKVLEGANIKLGSVSTNLGGVSGRAILAALAEGTDDPEALAGLAKGRLRNKHELLVEALAGSVGSHQRFLLATQLRHLADLDALIESLDAEIKERLRPAEEVIERLSTIPGVGGRTAEVILVEIGQDMARFGSSRQLASWAGMCPGNYESAGVQRGGRTRRGSPWLRTALVGSARSASRTKTYLGAQYRRLAARRGAKRAFVAVGHTILGIVYAALTSGRPFDDLGVTYFDRRDADHVRRRLTRRLEAMGYVVTVEPSAA